MKIFHLVRKRVSIHGAVHKGHYVAHLSYLSAASMEHGLYGRAALVLLAFTVIAAFFHEAV